MAYDQKDSGAPWAAVLAAQKRDSGIEKVVQGSGGMFCSGSSGLAVVGWLEVGGTVASVKVRGAGLRID